MRIRTGGDGAEEPINMTSMMDMVFNLLIFFLVATTMAQEELDMQVKLPHSSSTRALSAPPKQLVINIQEDGTVVVSTQTYNDAALAEMLGRVARDEPDRNVLIRADKDGAFGHFAHVVDMCHQAGISEAKIGYLREQ